MLSFVVLFCAFLAGVYFLTLHRSTVSGDDVTSEASAAAPGAEETSPRAPLSSSAGSGSSAAAAVGSSAADAKKKARKPKTAAAAAGSKRKGGKAKGKKRKHIESPLILHWLRAHNGSVDQARFSDDGRYLASVGQDGAVLLWNGIAIDADHAPVYTRITLDFAHAKSVAWGPDAKWVVVATETECQVHSVKEKGGALATKPLHAWKHGHKETPSALLVSEATHSLITMCPSPDDTRVVWRAPSSGAEQRVVDMRQLFNRTISETTDGEFVGIATRMATAQVLHFPRGALTINSATGQAVAATASTSPKRKFLLKHNKGCTWISFACNPAEREYRAVTSSEDRRWSLWHLPGEPFPGEEAKQLLEGSAPADIAFVAYSLPCRTVIVASAAGEVWFFDDASGAQVEHIARVVNDDSKLLHLEMAPDGLRFVTAGSDNAVRVWQMPGRD